VAASRSRSQEQSFHGGKKGQLRRDRQSEIHSSNRKMVENMAAIIRHGGPTCNNPFQTAYRKVEASSGSINLRRRNKKIEEENRRLKYSIAHAKPEISAKAHAKVRSPI
jgi:hypothetical protein